MTTPGSISSAAERGAAFHPGAPAEAGSPDAPLRVLVVDDDDLDRMIVRRSLARSGIAAEVHEASTGPEALAHVSAAPVDCVLMDYNIPGADGLTLLRALRSARLDLPVVVLTGQGDEQVAVALMKAGATDYVPKGALTSERLGQSLRYAVELARAAMATRAAERELHEAAERTRFLADASRVLSGSLDVRTTMQAVARLGVGRLGELCVIALAGPDGVHDVVAEHADPARAGLARAVEAMRAPRGPAPHGLLATVRSGRTERVDTVDDAMLAAAAHDPEELAVLRALRPRSALLVPLVARGTVLGAAAFVRDVAGAPDEREVALAEDLAQRAAMALDNARLFAIATEERQRAEAAAARTGQLQRITAALAGAATEAEVGELVMRHGVLPTGAYAGVIAVPTDDGALELATCIGYPEEACMHPGRRWPIDARIPLAEAARTGQPVFVESPEAWAARYPGGYAPAAANGAPPAAPRPAAPPSASRAWAALPLEGDDAHGVVLWTFDAPRTFGDDDRAFMAAIAQQCAQARERARLRDSERRARAAAEEANKAKSEFLARMSHDLRTPLNAIGGYSQLIEMGVHGPVTEAQLAAVLRIRRAQEHLLTLINDILSFAKLEAGQVSVTSEPVQLRPVLDELSALVRPEAESRRLALDIAMDGEETFARADRARLMQILLNLTSNALKFTAEGGVRVAVAPSGDQVELCVSDTGCGIASDRLESIFAPFVQARGAADEQKGGVGLGLAISRELARLMGGELTVESEVGRGSTFRLRLARA